MLIARFQERRETRSTVWHARACLEIEGAGQTFDPWPALADELKPEQRAPGEREAAVAACALLTEVDAALRLELVTLRKVSSCV